VLGQAQGALFRNSKMISGPETSQGWMYVKDLALACRPLRFAQETEASPVRDGKIAPAHVCRFSTDGKGCLVSLVK
jgi:hypothetical protein